MTDQVHDDQPSGQPLGLRCNEGLGPTPPLPRKKAAVFHHPTLDMPLYDGLAMDLHAMTYAEPLFAEIARLTAALKKANDQAERLAALEDALRALADAADEVGVRHFDTDWLDDEVQAMKNATLRAREVLGPNAESTGGRRPSGWTPS
jgi:uncharacterized membrane protein YccC